MAGGTFDPLYGKVRPGDYINFESQENQAVGVSERGIVLLPLINAKWGPDATFVTILNSAPDEQIDKLGKSVYEIDNNMLLVREALKNANKVIVYPINKGTKAKAVIDELTVEALYPGEMGNEIIYISANNPAGGFDVKILFREDIVGDYTGISNIEELKNTSNNYVTFAGVGELKATAGTKLSGGTSGKCTNSDITKFLDATELVKWNTMCFPLDNTVIETEGAAEALKAALKTKISYLRNNAGKYVKAVVADYPADFEGIINVTNSVVLNTGEKLTHAQVTAWVAGIDSAASNTQSNTYTSYSEAVEIVDPKTNEEAIEAINKGEFFFSTFENENGVVQIGVEYDINSLVSFSAKKRKDYRKNRVIRVYDTFSEALQMNFPPNKYDNNPEGWAIMEGQGKKLLKQFGPVSDGGAGAIKNVDYENDFKVDQSKSKGDETYFVIGLEACDSAEKLYFTVKTR